MQGIGFLYTVQIIETEIAITAIDEEIIKTLLKYCCGFLFATL